MLARTKEEHKWHQWLKLLADFPWLYAIKGSWDYRSDDVGITDNLNNLRVLLLCPARDEGVELWAYGEVEYTPKIFPAFPKGGWVRKVSHSDGKTLWAKQMADLPNPSEVIRHVAVKFPHDPFYIIYRTKDPLNLGAWITRLSETHTPTDAMFL